MFNGHLFKVILGFCGVIVLGLISLVFIDSLKERDIDIKAEVPMVESETPINTQTNPKSPKFPKSTTNPTTKAPTNKTP